MEKYTIIDISQAPFRGLRYLSLTLLLIICGCRQSDQNQAEFIDVDVKTQAELSEFFESFSYLELESDDSCYMVGIDKLIIDDERIYVLDERTNSVVIFDRAGGFINVIKKQGRGPHEYLHLSDFDVSSSGVYVLDRANEKIRLYSVSGEWLKDYELDNYYDYFQIVDQQYFYLGSDNSNSKGYNFIIYDIPNEKIIAEFDPFGIDYGRKSAYSPFLGRGPADCRYVSKEFDHTVYSLTPESMSPIYRFRFNTDASLPENIVEMDYDDLRDMVVNKPVVNSFMCFYETEDMLLLAYPLFNTTYALQYNIAKVDKKTGTAINHRLNETKDESFPFAGRPLLIEDGVVVSAMESINIIRLKEMYPEMEKIQRHPIEREDGFVLFFHKLKP